MFSDLRSFTEAVQQKIHPDLIIADIRLPDGSFISFLSSEENTRISYIPCIFISSVDDADVVRICYNRGRSDYITKPFGKAELAVKIERMLEGKGVQCSFAPFDLEIDYTSLTVIKGKRRSQPLTSKEFQIISAFCEANKQSLMRADIISKVWGQVAVQTKTLDVHLYNLRQKLQPIGLEIRFVPPRQYMLQAMG